MKIKFVPLIIFIALSVVSCKEKAPYMIQSGKLMGSDYTLEYQSKKWFTASIDSIMQMCNRSVNIYNPQSILSRVNDNKEVEVDQWFTDILYKGIELSEMTGGIFDTTCLPLVRFWLNGGLADWDNITKHQVDSILKYVGYRKVRIENRRVVKNDPRITMTLTAMVKGYTCDRIAIFLEEQGVENYFLNIGGAVVRKGVDKEGDPWEVSIRRPEETPDNRTVNMAEIIQNHGHTREALATSGDFQNYYIKNGKKYAYTVNPLTGYLSEQNVLSSTVLAKDGATCEGLSTAFTIMGLEEAVRIADSLPGVEYFFIYTDRHGNLQVKSSEGMRQHIK